MMQATVRSPTAPLRLNPQLEKKKKSFARYIVSFLGFLFLSAAQPVSLYFYRILYLFSTANTPLNTLVQTFA